MCRYAGRYYRDHFACFECRKAFKHWLWEMPKGRIDFPKRRELQSVKRTVVCPECSRPMADMGLDFRAPRRSDREGWEVMRALFAAGMTFHSCGCSVGFTPPRLLRKMKDWLGDQRRQSKGERLSAAFATRRSK